VVGERSVNGGRTPSPSSPGLTCRGMEGQFATTSVRRVSRSLWKTSNAQFCAQLTSTVGLATTRQQVGVNRTTTRTSESMQKSRRRIRREPGTRACRVDAHVALPKLAPGSDKGRSGFGLPSGESGAMMQPDAQRWPAAASRRNPIVRPTLFQPIVFCR
jgi:hypothetical protein